MLAVISICKFDFDVVKAKRNSRPKPNHNIKCTKKKS